MNTYIIHNSPHETVVRKFGEALPCARIQNDGLVPVIEGLIHGLNEVQRAELYFRLGVFASGEEPDDSQLCFEECDVVDV